MRRLMRDTWMILFVMVAMAIPAVAQEDLPTEEIEVIKDFDARLIDARKLKINAQLPALDSATRKYTYQVTTQPLDIAYASPTIRPLAMKTEKQPTIYNGFLRGGYGFPNSPLIEAGYNLITKSDANLGIRLRHHSAEDKDLRFQQFSKSYGKIDGSWHRNSALTIQGSAGYRQDDIYFYGYDHRLTEIEEIDVKRRYKDLNAEVRIANTERLQGDINYSVSAQYYKLKDSYANNEQGMLLAFAGEKWIKSQHPVLLEVITDFSTLDDIRKRDLNNFFFKPSFTFQQETFSLKLGGNLALHKDDYHLFPEIEGSAKILGDRLSAFAGWNGTLVKNNFRTLSDYNPFIHTRIDSIGNTEVNHLYGGVKGRVKIFSFEGRLGYKMTEKLALYGVPEGEQIPKFQPIYDDVDIFHIEGAVTASPMDKLEAGFTITKNFYNLETQEEAWHLPGLETNVFASYLTMEDNLRLRADIFFVDGVYGKDLDGDAEKLNAVFDVSLSADYYVTENIGAFVKVNNLAGTKWMRWQDYPSFGINGNAGVLLRF